MPSDEKKTPMEDLKEKFRALFTPGSPQKKKDGLPPKAHFSIWYFLIAFFLITYLQQYFFSQKVETIPYSQFKQNLVAGNVTKLIIGPENIYETLKGLKIRSRRSLRCGWMIPIWSRSWMNIRSITPDAMRVNCWAVFSPGFSPRHHVLGLAVCHEKDGAGDGRNVLRQEQGQAFAQNETMVTFADVAGIDEAKEELQEVVEFLKNPAKFQKLGGRIPKGVLLSVHRGPGKPCLPRRWPARQKCLFFSISGSEFVEMFVGVGIACSRSLSQAASQAPLHYFHR